MKVDQMVPHAFVRVNQDDPAWQRALKRALIFAPALPPVLLGSHRDDDGVPVAVTVAVPSRSQPGREHLVLVGRDDQVCCECEAGLEGRPCWHAAAAWLWIYRFLDPVTVRIALNQYADPARIERERAHLEAALAGVLV